MSTTTPSTLVPYTAPEGFVPQLDELGKPVFWDGPFVHVPGHGYKIEVSWAPHEGMSFFVITDADRLGMDDMEHLERTISGLRLKYAAYAVMEDDWLRAQEFDAEGATLNDCISFASEVGIPFPTVAAIWEELGRFDTMKAAVRR